MRKPKDECRFTEIDLIRAFRNWRDMHRTEGADWPAVENAWHEYCLIRDEMDYKPFPRGTIIARSKITRRIRNEQKDVDQEDGLDAGEVGGEKITG